MKTLLRMIGVGWLAWALAGCSLPPRPPQAAMAIALRLSPASLGHDLALQQHLTVFTHGRSEQLDVAIEADAESVRVAFLAFGGTVARLDWDGRDLKEVRAKGWPAVVSGEGVLDDLQMIHWPLDAIRHALPPGWTMQEGDGIRTLQRSGVPMVRVRYASHTLVELDNIAAGYQLRLVTAPEAP